MTAAELRELPELRVALAWGLGEACAADDAVRAAAGRGLAACTAWLEASAWPEVAARFSGLNADGCPVEFAFGSRDAAVRYTAEVAAPEVSERERLGCAEMIAGALPAALRAELAALQAGALTWGAAIAGRHDDPGKSPTGDVRGDRYKIYAEATRDAGAAAAATALVAAIERAGLARAPRLVMVGWDAAADVVEYYLRSDGFAPGDFARLCDACGLGARAGELEHAAATAYGGGTAARALKAVWGVSLAGPRGGEFAAVSLFKEANRLFGGDGRCRARIVELVRALDAGALDAYARYTARLAQQDTPGAHGMIAFTAANGRPLEIRIGVSALAAWRGRTCR